MDSKSTNGRKISRHREKWANAFIIYLIRYRITGNRVKVFEKLKQWQHYQEGPVLRVWIDLLLSANYKDSWCRGKKVKAGEVVTSVAQIMDSTGIKSNNTVLDALRKLESSGDIKRVQFDNASKITINHWDIYQGYAPTAQPTAHIQEYIEGKEIIFTNYQDNSLSASPTENIPWNEIVNFFNETTKGIFGKIRLPFSETRKSLVRARINGYGIETFYDVIRKAAASKFLSGDNNRNWMAIAKIFIVLL